MGKLESLNLALELVVHRALIKRAELKRADFLLCHPRQFKAIAPEHLGVSG